MINTRLEFNKAYSGSYILLPLAKEHNGMKVTTGMDTKETAIDKDKLEELISADKDKNHLLTLEEIKSSENSNEFWTRLKQEMELFDSNPHKDYRKNMFEFFV